MRKPRPAALDALPPEIQEAIRAHVREEVDRALAERADLARASNRVTMVVFSGDLDKVIASMVIATGAAAMGMQVSMFFTFWGLNVLRRGRRLRGKGVLTRAMALLTPAGIKALGVSRLHMAGAGPHVLRRMMKTKGVASPEELFALARESGVRMVACTMSMDVLGFARDELVDGIEVGGVAAYLGDAADSRVTLFI